MFPTHDWQFWIATALALGALLWLVRKLAPSKARRAKRNAARATLTVGGKAVGKNAAGGNAAERKDR